MHRREALVFWHNAAMPFPLTLAGRVISSPHELAALAQADAAGEGGSVIPGLRPWQWVLGLVADGSLEPRLAMGLGAALLQNPNPVTVAEGARLAVGLHPSPLDRLVVLALDAHDAALLLQVDPGRPGASVEDSLLRSAVEVAPLDDALTRTTVLTRLRNAGLPALEFQVLMEHGTLADVRRWMPALLEEGLEDEDRPHLQKRIERGDEVAIWLQEQGI
jgi:hypothetical protein